MLEEAMVSAAKNYDVKILEVLFECSNQDMVGRAIVNAASTRELLAAELLMRSCNPELFPDILVRSVKNGIVGLIKLLVNKVDTQALDSALRLASDMEI